jgi:hypothetical protein
VRGIEVPITTAAPAGLRRAAASTGRASETREAASVTPPRRLFGEEGGLERVRPLLGAEALRRGDLMADRLAGPHPAGPHRAAIHAAVGNRQQRTDQESTFRSAGSSPTEDRAMDIQSPQRLMTVRRNREAVCARTGAALAGFFARATGGVQWRH